MRIYFPMSCRVLTLGHIRCLQWLNSKGKVTIGLLSTRALKGYKDEIVPYDDRRAILRVVAKAIGPIKIVKQDDLNPSENLRKWKHDALASGDGFEGVELEAIKRYNLKRIDVKLPGERSKKYSSTKILRGGK